MRRTCVSYDLNGFFITVLIVGQPSSGVNYLLFSITFLWCQGSRDTTLFRVFVQKRSNLRSVGVTIEQTINTFNVLYQYQERYNHTYKETFHSNDREDCFSYHEVEINKSHK